MQIDSVLFQESVKLLEIKHFEIIWICKLLPTPDQGLLWFIISSTDLFKNISHYYSLLCILVTCCRRDQISTILAITAKNQRYISQDFDFISSRMLQRLWLFHLKITDFVEPFSNFILTSEPHQSTYSNWLNVTIHFTLYNILQSNVAKQLSDKFVLS